MAVSGKAFGRHADGLPVETHAISAHGLTAQFMTHGAALMRLVPDGGNSVVLGFDRYDDYLDKGRHFGAIVGRYANRIGGAQVVIDGRRHVLDRNFLDRHTLHGGQHGSGQRNWVVAGMTPDSITLTDRLPDGHMGFPGNLDVAVRYRILAGPVLEIEITAQTDAATLCNFAQHSYFNLTAAETILGHELTVQADHYLPVDDERIPTGRVVPVAGTRFDFRRPVRLGARLPQGLIDHNLCLARARTACRPVARLSTPDAGFALTLETTEPGLQIYDGTHIGHQGLALEPQIWPDAPHQPDFPDAMLRPGQTYRQLTRLVLSANRD